MILSRVKPALSSAKGETSKSGSASSQGSGKGTNQFEEYLSKRDYVGALTYLEYAKSDEDQTNSELWMAYCSFHNGDYKTSLERYIGLNNMKLKEIPVNLACCYFYLGMYQESRDALGNASNSPLKNRLNFHLSYKLQDESALMESHEQLGDVIEDQLSLAAMHYLRAHYQEAIDIYKRLLVENRDNFALNVYIAQCYYKLDYYDMSEEMINLYLQQYADSVIATNLKACNYFRVQDGGAAEHQLRNIIDHCITNAGFGCDLVRHNLVVFRDGEDAMQVLPNLVDVIPEARLNLVIHHLRNENLMEAYELLKDLDPTVPYEYILKGVVNAALGQELNSMEHIKKAEECFKIVGGSTTECDTLHGRQCMASHLFLDRQFEDVLMYLTSIKSYLCEDDTFNFNYGQAKIACGQYKDGEEALLQIKNSALRKTYVYISHLARCYIMNDRPHLAWDLYENLEETTNDDMYNLLLLLANDFYRQEQFWYAAKVFHVLDKIDPNPEFWEGKRGAIVGVFQGVIRKKWSKDLLYDMIEILKTCSSAQADHILTVIERWIQSNS